jgi:hypothetical protein
MVLAKGFWIGTLYKLDVTTQFMGSGNVVSMERGKSMTSLNT